MTAIPQRYPFSYQVFFLTLLIVANTAEAIMPCGHGIQIATRLQTLEWGSFRLGSSREATGSNPEFIERVKETYRGILQVSLQIGALRVTEIEKLKTTRGLSLLGKESSALSLQSQEAIEVIGSACAAQGLTTEQTEAIFSDVITELFEPANHRHRSTPLRLSPQPQTSHPLVDSRGKLQPQIQLTFSPYQDEIYASTPAGEIYQFSAIPNPKRELPPWKLIYQTNLSGPHAPPIVLSPTGEHLAIDSGTTLTLYSLKENRRLWSFAGEKKVSMQFSSDGQRLITIGPREPVNLFDVDRGLQMQFSFRLSSDFQNRPELTTPRKGLKGLFQSFFFSPTGDYLVLWGEEHRFILRATEDPEVDHVYGTSRSGQFFGFFYEDSFTLTDGSGNPSQTGFRNTHGTYNDWRSPTFRFKHWVVNEKKKIIFGVTNESRQVLPLQPLWGGTMNHLPAFTGAKAQRSPITGLRLSNDAKILAVLTDRNTYFWNVTHPEAPRFIASFDFAFPNTNGATPFGFSHTGRFFVGVTTNGNFVHLDLAHFESWQ